MTIIGTNRDTNNINLCVLNMFLGVMPWFERHDTYLASPKLFLPPAHLRSRARMPSYLDTILLRPRN